MSDTQTIGLAVVSLLATTWMAYRWGLRSQKLQRDAVANSALKERRRLFLNLPIEIKSRIETSGFMGDWVVRFVDQYAPTLKSEFALISRELEGVERIRIGECVERVFKFSTLSQGDIYAQKEKILEALELFPKT